MEAYNALADKSTATAAQKVSLAKVEAAVLVKVNAWGPTASDAAYGIAATAAVLTVAAALF